MTRKTLALAAVASLGLGGCNALSSGTVEDIPKNAKETSGTFNNESLFGQDGLSLGRIADGVRGGDPNVLPVNKYLWRASLETLSFLPLAAADPYSGTISTDWGGVAASPSERVRATVYIEGKELTARALDVAVFQERLNGSAWVPAQVDPATAAQLKTSILDKARQLRIADVDGA